MSGTNTVRVQTVAELAEVKGGGHTVVIRDSLLKLQMSVVD